MPIAPTPVPDPLHWPRPRDAIVFLDFDGTLVDIADTPDGITVTDDLEPLLQLLWSGTDGRTYIVSGRAVPDVARYLRSFRGDIFGGHGAQSRIDGHVYDHPLTGSGRVAGYQKAIRAYVTDNAGTLAEMKDAGAVLHYRKAPELAADAGAFVENLVADDPDMTAHPAKMAIEIKPVDVDKGTVVEKLMKTGRTPIFCGDDTTDEAAFAVVNQADGITVKIGDGETIAQTRLPHPAAVRAMLWNWLREGRA